MVIAFVTGFGFTTRSKIIATIALTLVAAVAYWYFLERSKQGLLERLYAEEKRIEQEVEHRHEEERRVKRERERIEIEEFQQRAAEMEDRRLREARIAEDLEANKRTKGLKDRIEKLRERSEEANRAVASFILVAETVQTIRPFAFVGTRAQENAPEILRYIGNACSKIQTTQSAQCIDTLKSEAGSYCRAVARVAQESITNPRFFTDEDARFRLHIWIRDRGFIYDAAFNNCKALLEKERVAIAQETIGANKTTSAGQ